MKRAAVDAGYILVVSSQLSPALFTGFRFPALEDETVNPFFFWDCYYHLTIPLYIAEFHLLYFAGRLDIPGHFPKPAAALHDMFGHNRGIYIVCPYLYRPQIPGYLLSLSLSILFSRIFLTIN